MARKISFINYKGGVGKTSIVVNIAGVLAKMGLRVLVVDLDAQSNSSVWLMRLDRWNLLAMGEGKGLISIFIPGKDHLRDCILEDVVQDREEKILLPGLDLIPTTFEFIDLEHEFQPPHHGENHFQRFSRQIQEIESDYDYILFDCPPNVLRASESALFACNEIYVPANPDALS